MWPVSDVHLRVCSMAFNLGSRYLLVLNAEGNIEQALSGLLNSLQNLSM